MDPTQCEQRPDGVWACNNCGFAYDASHDDVVRRLAGAATRLRQTVERLDPAAVDVGVRPGLWSVRQYLAHMADWAEIIATRIRTILAEDEPAILDIDQDARASEQGYQAWDIAKSLDRYANGITQAIEAISDGGSAGWSRVGTREPFGRQPVSAFGQDLLHELEHHLVDISGNLH